jgi:lipopolysaccharide transport system ATP-binding protein
VGDTAFQRKCLGKMDGVTREGRTVLLVSHDLTSIQVLCQRALRLGRGEVAGLGPVESEIRAYLAESRSIAGVELDHPVPINESVNLVRFGCAPSPVPSGDAADCQVALEASRDTRIDELTVLIQDGLNRRIAVIDYRTADGSHRVGPGHPLALMARLTSVPLVEGEYRLGLSIRTDEGQTVKHDLATMEVVSRQNQEIVPHSASMRGVASFDYRIDKA